jgi:3-hydroxybutyryl-CoA dehydrogenase
MRFRKKWLRPSGSEEKLSTDFIVMTSVRFDDILLVFGFGTKQQLKALLQENPTRRVFMDLTCYDPQEFYESYPQLHGAFAGLFAGEDKKIEIHFRKKEPKVLEKLHALGFKAFETTIVSCGFIFPRTIVQIINEAYFAIEEKVASKKDINRAMMFGVNYPKGPFDWSEGRERYVCALLDELHEKTQNPRYRRSPLISY